MIKLEEIRKELVNGNMFTRIVESRFGDYIEIFKKGSSDPVAYITLNKGDDTNNRKVRRDLIDIEAERRFNKEWDEHLPLIKKFVKQLKDAGFKVDYTPSRTNAGVIVYANELKISMNFGCFENNIFSRHATIYIDRKVIWSVNCGTDRLLEILTTGDYIHNLIADEEKTSEELSHWFKQLDLSDDD